MRGRLYIALLHHPVLDREGRVITSAVTNADIHDIARSAKTYGVKRFFIVTPIADQADLVRTIIGHWTCGAGGALNPSRREALESAGGCRQSGGGSRGDRPRGIGPCENCGDRRPAGRILREPRAAARDPGKRERPDPFHFRYGVGARRRDHREQPVSVGAHLRNRHIQSSLGEIGRRDHAGQGGGTERIEGKRLRR